MKKVLIVGGVAGGAATAARLRRNDENVHIVIFEKGKYISYANCGLPYYIGGTITERDQLFVQNEEDFSKRFNLDIRTCNEVISVNTDEKYVTVMDLTRERQYTESYDKLVLSPGAKPVNPPVKGIDSGKNVFRLRNVDDTDRIKDYIKTYKPEKAVIIGAGYIGIEMAENLNKVCSSVTVVELADRVIPFFDFEMSAMIEQHLTSGGINIMLNERVTSYEDNQVVLQSGKRVSSDILIVAAGVKPDTAFLEGSGINLTANGSIIVDKHLLTSNRDVYAIGDAISCRHKVLETDLSIYLAGPASKQGRITADNIVNDNKTVYEGTIGTAILKAADITAGYTGISEDSLKRQNRPYITSYTHSNNHAGYYPNALPMTIKLLFHPQNGTIYGSQIIGYEGIDKRLDVIAALIHKKGTIYDLTEYDHAYAPPYSSAKDPLTIAGFAAENIIKGKVRIVHWYDLDDEFLADKELIDVRTEEENQIESIPGSRLIPLDELRERLDEIPKNKKLIIYCRAGQRGYLACRILMQKGFSEVYNLSGGYKTYAIAKHLTYYEDLSEEEQVNLSISSDTDPNYNQQSSEAAPSLNADSITLKINACGLQCPGPIIKLKEGIDNIKSGETLQIEATDPGFINDLKSWCRVTGNELLKLDKSGTSCIAFVKKTAGEPNLPNDSKQEKIPVNGKTLIVFSDDMDRALASFVIANGAAAMGRQVTIFFTFWGLNVIKKEFKPKTKRDFMGLMFGKMMPGNSKKLGLSKMNMLGMGPVMMRKRMKDKQVDSLEKMIATAIDNGVRLIACQMSMDVMGVVKEDLIDGIEIGGVATYLEEAEKANLNLFI